MKKWIKAGVCFALAAALAGCGGGGKTAAKTDEQNAGVKNVLEAGMAAADNKAGDSTGAGNNAAISNSGVSGENGANDSGENGADGSGHQSGVNKDAPLPEKIDESEMYAGTEGIDIDLTVLSSTVVYSEVYNMASSPEDYVGKTVRMRGFYSSFYDKTTGKNYFACVISDATACCSRGIEFIPADDYNYPDDYPEEADEITVTGVFDTYEENGYTYCTIRDAGMIIEN